MTPNIPQWLKEEATQYAAKYAPSSTLGEATEVVKLAYIAAYLRHIPTDEELQREAKEEYPHDKPFNRAYTGIEVVELQRLAYINGRKKIISVYDRSF